jgi:two-component system, chemotaxis family, sensor kinase CheA
MGPVRVFDLQNFSLDDLVDCGAEIRGITGIGSFEETANAAAKLLAERLVDADGKPACALVRCYATVRYARLPAPLQAFARELAGFEPPPETRCLTLMGSYGDEPEWRTRSGSRGHKAIPLLSAEFVRGIPMLRQLLLEFGLTPEQVTSGDPTMLLRQREDGFNVFYVPTAPGSAFIPAQDGFVRPYGISSVLGFGASMPSGELVAMLMFSRAEIPRQTAELFRSLALSARYAFLPHCMESLFAGEQATTTFDAVVAKEKDACLTDLLTVFQRSAISVNQSLKQITDHVTFGFLVIDRELRIDGGHTRSCNELFGKTHLVGRPLTEILDIDDPVARACVEVGLQQFYDDVLPEEVLLNQVQHTFLVKGRVLRIHPRCIRSAAGEVSHLLVTVSDDTALVDARRQAATLESLVSILRQREAFSSFLTDFRRGVAEVTGAAARGDRARARRELHTLKGNAGCFGVGEVADLIHHIEAADDLSELSIHRIEKTMRTFLESHWAVLRIDYAAAEAPVVGVPSGALAELEELAATLPDGPARALQAWTRRALFRPIGPLFGPLDRQVQALAAKLEREVELVIRGGDTLVDAGVLAPVLRNFTHAVRNAIDHGIEPAALRHPKPRQGQVSIDVTESPTAWHVVIADDGRGVDVAALCESAVRQGLVTRETLGRFSPDDRLKLVFADGLTTSDRPSEVSGRGVGMGALREAVVSAGGDVRVTSERGAGTRIAISIPKPSHPATFLRAG